MADGDFNAIPLKRCNKCGEEKPATPEFFHKDKTCRFGVAPTCKPCMAKYHAQKYEANKAAIRQRDREWTKNHPDKKDASKQRRKERLRQSDGYGVPFYKRKQIAAQRGCCYYCQAPLGERDVHIDHKVPISRGGSNLPENKVICCHRCNARKHTKTAEEFLAILAEERSR